MGGAYPWAAAACCTAAYVHAVLVTKRVAAIVDLKYHRGLLFVPGAIMWLWCCVALPTKRKGVTAGHVFNLMCLCLYWLSTGNTVALVPLAIATAVLWGCIAVRFQHSFVSGALTPFLCFVPAYRLFSGELKMPK